MTVDEVEKQIKKLVDENNMRISYCIDFPIYRILPNSVKLALDVIQEHKVSIKMTLEEKK